jgi:hypothetical protein
MANVAHNGFGCPYCRTELTDKKTKRTRQVGYDDSEDDDDDIDYDSECEDDNDSLYGEDVLRGLRLFTNNLNGEEVAEEDIQEEQEYMRHAARFRTITSGSIMEKLVAKGITMEDVVKIVVLHEDAFARLVEITE